MSGPLHIVLLQYGLDELDACFEDLNPAGKAYAVFLPVTARRHCRLRRLLPSRDNLDPVREERVVPQRRGGIEHVELVLAVEDRGEEGLEV